MSIVATNGEKKTKPIGIKAATKGNAKNVRQYLKPRQASSHLHNSTTASAIYTSRNGKPMMHITADIAIAHPPPNQKMPKGLVAKANVTRTMWLEISPTCEAKRMNLPVYVKNMLFIAPEFRVATSPRKSKYLFTSRPVSGKQINEVQTLPIRKTSVHPARGG
jgi:hypothetical protein